MHVVAEVSGFSHTVDVEAAAVIGSHYSTDYEILIRNRLTRENHQKYFQAKAQGKVFASSGRAGSGKTETIKDIERALGVEPIVLQTSDDMSLVDALGTLPEGSVVIFDEFNRLEEQMLSACSEQILTIQTGLKANSKTIEILGRPVRLNPGVGIFITMNPGYAGRSNLPDNLKQLFREMAMITPNKTLIAQVLLFSRGFASAETLAGKIVSLFDLCLDQLSQQPHYVRS